ncbi:MAG: cytochrome c oxidase subunit I [Candidatus Tectomicrobia bacterium RIFCSPLOWO2_02_FULL_70_19]|nr:MAG: cytochrome c oxidase subunit I [Candidatus Tectomicrobia bacterium RIFCSPLOWO2_02_FULL_70_19]
MSDSTAAAAHHDHHAGGFWTTYVFSTDHKMIARQFLWLGLLMMVLGGIMALMFRWQLAWPETPVWGFGWVSQDSNSMPTGIITPNFYNMLVTMHATIMVFMVVMPILVGCFGNFLIPLMIGARDMAFPVLNMLSFWAAVLGGAIMMAGFQVEGGHAASGWTGYAPLSTVEKYTGVGWGQNLWALSLFVLSLSSLMGAVNYITTVINMRTAGMTWFRMPLAVWSLFITAILSLLALPVLGSAVALMFFDRVFGTTFFNPAQGGEPLLWQHLFWYFGHPEVYILILPGMGIASDLLSVFSRKPIFGYRAMVYSMCSIAFLSWLVWGHHMFQSGMSPYLGSAFMMTTLVIAIPSAIKTFNWLGTLWGGSIRFTVPMMHALSFVILFVIGGLSGIFMASNVVDIYIHDTYFIVAHFHYVIFGGSMFAIFGGVHYWFPKMFNKHMDDALGRVHFWLTFIFFNLAFFPMHIIGVGGHMRRIYNPMQYDFLKDIQPVNVLITLGALGLGLGQIPFVFNFLGSIFRWNARWFRALAQAAAALACGLVAYRVVLVAAVGLMPKAPAGGGARTVAGLIALAVIAWVFRYLAKNMGEMGRAAAQNPWDASTLEWVAPTPAPHGNFGPALPIVQRGPYEYSVPDESADWAPQTKPLSAQAAAASH